MFISISKKHIGFLTIFFSFLIQNQAFSAQNLIESIVCPRIVQNTESGWKFINPNIDGWEMYRYDLDNGYFLDNLKDTPVPSNATLELSAEFNQTEDQNLVPMTVECIYTYKYKESSDMITKQFHILYNDNDVPEATSQIDFNKIASSGFWKQYDENFICDNASALSAEISKCDIPLKNIQVKY